jgi:hypothetical protein
VCFLHVACTPVACLLYASRTPVPVAAPAPAWPFHPRACAYPWTCACPWFVCVVCCHLGLQNLCPLSALGSIPAIPGTTVAASGVWGSVDGGGSGAGGSEAQGPCAAPRAVRSVDAGCRASPAGKKVRVCACVCVCVRERRGEWAA